MKLRQRDGTMAGVHDVASVSAPSVTVHRRFVPPECHLQGWYAVSRVICVDGSQWRLESSSSLLHTGARLRFAIDASFGLRDIISNNHVSKPDQGGQAVVEHNVVWV